VCTLVSREAKSDFSLRNRRCCKDRPELSKTSFADSDDRRNALQDSQSLPGHDASILHDLARGASCLSAYLDAFGAASVYGVQAWFNATNEPHSYLDQRSWHAVSLPNSSGPVDRVKTAKDSADLPAHVSARAQRTITVGETFDVEFMAASPQDLLLAVAHGSRRPEYWTDRL
jgi:hypothetical protein